MGACSTRLWSPGYLIATADSDIVSDEGVDQRNLVAEWMKDRVELINEVLCFVSFAARGGFTVRTSGP